MKPKVYISGPMSGLPNLNFPKFDRIKRRLERHAFTVVSPADLDRQRDSSMTYQERLKDDIVHLLECECIFMLDGWQTSLGATVERAIAIAIGLAVIYENEIF